MKDRYLRSLSTLQTKSQRLSAGLSLSSQTPVVSSALGQTCCRVCITQELTESATRLQMRILTLLLVVSHSLFKNKWHLADTANKEFMNLMKNCHDPDGSNVARLVHASY